MLDSVRTSQAESALIGAPAGTGKTRLLQEFRLDVKLADVQWYQAGANAPGREEKVELNLPKGVTITRVADRSLSELLAA